MLSLFDKKYYGQCLGKHFMHFMINSPLLIVVVFFYDAFGFYGWDHLLSIIFLAYSIIPLDDFIDKKQRFPYYVIPMLVFSGFFYPMVTILALAGCIIINLRAILNSDSLILERVEGIGMLPLGVFPYVLPLNIWQPAAFLPVLIMVMAIDSFHKIAHRETKNEKFMWISGLFFILLLTILYARSPLDFTILICVITLPLIGLRILRNSQLKYINAYYHTWQAIVIIILFAKYPAFLISNFQI